MNEQEYNEMIKRCLRCSICKWIPQLQIKSQKYASICPSIDMFNFHAYSAGGRIIIALALEMGRLKPSKELMEIVYKCTECGGCDVSCKFLNTLEPLEIIVKLREKLVSLGYGPMPKQQKYIKSIKNSNNPYNEPHENRLNWLSNDIKIEPDAKVLYFVGCTSSYRRKEIANATARVMNAANYPFKILIENEYCCGSPILRTGDKKSFINQVNKNIDIIEKKGIETVVFSCAGCYDTFKVDYPLEREYNFKILHTTELFNDLIEKSKLELNNQVLHTVTYHDPCHLGRNSEPYEKWDGESLQMMPLVSINMPEKPKRCGANGIYNSPRNLLNKIPGLKFIEMERIKEYSYCCGAGGGVKSAFPEFALKTAKTRIEEAEDTGAEIIISACPFCSTNLKDGIVEKGSNLSFYDISELLLMAIDSPTNSVKESSMEVT
ncbi:MAG: (Fe-S)-binding protein [Candidatus Lokiarchaeota archaeon]|nr:(Fe-S)-binding protein [Candidatus Lokiarchaeota archaeon]